MRLNGAIVELQTSEKNTHAVCNVAPVSGKLELYVVNKDEKVKKSALAQNRMLIDFHMIAQVVVNPKTTSGNISVVFYLDGRPRLYRKSWENTTSKLGNYIPLSIDDSFTSVPGSAAAHMRTSVPEQILCLDFPKAYYNTEVKNVLKEIASCWLVPVYEIEAPSVQATMDTMPQFSQTWDEQRKGNAKARLVAAGIGMYPASTYKQEKLDTLLKNFARAWEYCEFGKKCDCGDDELSAETAEICMQCDCQVCVRPYHQHLNPFPLKVKAGTYEDHAICNMENIEHQNTAGNELRRRQLLPDGTPERPIVVAAGGAAAATA
jgi:hypothetical protein